MPIDADPATLVSPCDAIVGACGRVMAGTVLQAKGFPYTLIDLLGDRSARRAVSQRLVRDAANHADDVSPLPRAARSARGAGDVHLRRHLERLSDRAASASRSCSARTSARFFSAAWRPTTRSITLVPVAAILVASIRLHFLDVLLHLRYRGPNLIPCDAPFRKGEEMGWFQHGSTIIVFAPAGVSLSSEVREGQRIRMGQPLFTL